MQSQILEFFHLSIANEQQSRNGITIPTEFRDTIRTFRDAQIYAGIKEKGKKTKKTKRYYILENYEALWLTGKSKIQENDNLFVVQGWWWAESINDPGFLIQLESASKSNVGRRWESIRKFDERMWTKSFNRINLCLGTHKQSTPHNQ